MRSTPGAARHEDPEMSEAAVMPAPADALLQVDGLSVGFRVGGRETRAVDDVSFAVDRGETVCLVGESGSGKSISALSIMRLLPAGAIGPGGRIGFDGRDLLTLPEAEMRSLRGNRIGMIFQEPLNALNPLHTIARQIGEAVELHDPALGSGSVRDRVIEMLSLVGLDNVTDRLGAYPHQLSGGQRQRVMIAMALANRPDLLIADEPTTALDVTVQKQILELIQDLKDRLGMAVLFITHDLGVVSKIADRVVVMRRGRVMETGPTTQVLTQPRHPYTAELIASEPKGHPAPVPTDAAPLMVGTDVKVHFPIKKGVLRRTVGHVKAVDGIDLTVHAGETVGVVGESGSGKSTLAHGLLRLVPSMGGIRFADTDIQGWPAKRMRPLRHRMQMVFQDPFGSLSPRLSVADIVSEGLDVHGLATDPAERARAVAEVLVEVGLPEDAAHRYPHEFSGGQRQRIAIARAMILKPDLVVLDEPTSALDVSVQAQIVDLLRKLQADHRLAYIFISHDLKVVRAMAHRVIVMKDGAVVETGRTETVMDAPQDPYTRRLIEAVMG